MSATYNVGHSKRIHGRLITSNKANVRARFMSIVPCTHSLDRHPEGAFYSTVALLTAFLSTFFQLLPHWIARLRFIRYHSAALYWNTCSSLYPPLNKDQCINNPNRFPRSPSFWTIGNKWSTDMQFEEDIRNCQ